MHYRKCRQEYFCFATSEVTVLILRHYRKYRQEYFCFATSEVTVNILRIVLFALS